MSAARHAIRPKPAPETVRRVARPQATPAATPRSLKPSLKLGGVNDPEEHEAENAAGIVAGGGSYQVRDPGGSASLRAAVAPPVLDTGASGRVRRACTWRGRARHRPLSTHWQSSAGNNTNDTARWTISDLNNLRYITERDNLALPKGRFEPWVGPSFTSTYAQGGQKNAKQIDGQSFLDAANNPI